MRLIPLLTAILVTLTLYGLVFERDTLIAFARGETAQDAQAPEPKDEIEASSPAAAADSGKIGVLVLKSQARQVDSAVILRGQTRANRQVEVRAETSATVLSEPLRKGAYVTKGDLLCQLEPGTREATLAEARARLSEAESRVPESTARLEEARARLKEAQVNWNAAEQLGQDGYASETRVAGAAAAVSAAEAGVASAESGLRTARAGIEAAAAAVAGAEREIERLTIRSPFEGLLESDAAELGSLMQPGSLCATVIQLDPIKLIGYVPETEVEKVSVGARAGALLATGRRVEGRVVFISRAADPTTRTFQVEITVNNADQSIRDGQTAEIAIAGAGTMAHLLPQSALTLNNAGSLGVRTVDDSDTVQFRSVRLLRDDAEGAWVLGLPDRSDVIIAGQDFVTEGVHVRPTYKEVTP